MNFEFSNRQSEWMERMRAFMQERVIASVPIYEAQMAAFGADRWQLPAIVEDLKEEARAAGLWNLFLPPSEHERDGLRGAGLSNLEYAPLAELTGRVEWAPELFNCSAPDTGNMELLLRYGSPGQQARWLKPLMDGKIRSAFLMTEPDVASSDATNVETSIVRDGDEYVVNGRKWWSSGMGDPRAEVVIVMGKTDTSAPKHAQQSMILVPRDAPGLTIVRMLPVFGFDDAPHGHAEVLLEDVRVPVENIILGEGRGFEIAQGRLGPGRIHHCMRTIGVAEYALEMMCRRLEARTAFGRKIADQTIWHERIAEARIDIEMSRLLTLKAADMMDKVGNKGAQLEIAMIKAALPKIACRIIDDAIQAWGGGGVTTGPGLAKFYAGARSLRIADGPDEVHNRAVARLELSKYR
ncbi:acyl-CoA dehydrogenase family protein [Novosphingobium sp. HII-3]|uniref:acyl-CoA dehydrogenase family protein n=1 Tax=Novosphingobium sp. HII-3 TaxID=2075565 RepID=UPI000CDA41CA|nr:acyl-CoA dehydrogenase family protein [Novosphingobium sp. HII-3]